MDPDLLVRDTRIYVHTIWRLLTDRVLPLDYAAQADCLARELASVAATLRDCLDLGSLVASVEALRAGAATLQARAKSLRNDDDAERINQALIAVARALVPMDYTRGDRFDHDPALGQAPYPVLDPLRRLAAARGGIGGGAFPCGRRAARLQPARPSRSTRRKRRCTRHSEGRRIRLRRLARGHLARSPAMCN